MPTISQSKDTRRWPKLRGRRLVQPFAFSESIRRDRPAVDNDDRALTKVRYLLLTSFQIELAGSENWNRLNAADFFRDPQIRNAGVAKLVAQLRKIDIDRRQNDQRFSLCFILYSHDRDSAFVAALEAEKV